MGDGALAPANEPDSSLLATRPIDTAVSRAEAPSGPEGAPQAPAVEDVSVPAADEFAAASAMFGVAAVPPAEPEVALADEPAPDYLGTEPRRARSNFRRVTTTSLSVGVIGVACALVVGMALPGSPLVVAEGSRETSAVPAEATDAGIPAFVVSDQALNTDVERSGDYQVLTGAQVAAETGIAYSTAVFINDPTAAIQWPFAVGTGMSYGYGVRDGVMHEGIDFTPGDGAPNQAIADGVVRLATESDSGYGVGVYIDHMIDGQLITSHYAHMQYGSLKVKTGDTVKVGDPIGLTGNTGHSFGAHLHFELIVNGQTIDPMPWLKEHAG